MGIDSWWMLKRLLSLSSSFKKWLPPEKLKLTLHENSYSGKQIALFSLLSFWHYLSIVLLNVTQSNKLSNGSYQSRSLYLSISDTFLRTICWWRSFLGSFVLKKFLCHLLLSKLLTVDNVSVHFLNNDNIDVPDDYEKCSSYIIGLYMYIFGTLC